MLPEVWVLSAPLIVPPLKSGNYSISFIHGKINDEDSIPLPRHKQGLSSNITIEFSIIRDAIVGKCRQKGLVIGGCGESTIRMRPSLIFEPRHAESMIEVMNDVVGSINMSN